MTLCIQKLFARSFWISTCVLLVFAQAQARAFLTLVPSCTGLPSIASLCAEIAAHFGPVQSDALVTDSRLSFRCGLSNELAALHDEREGLHADLPDCPSGSKVEAWEQASVHYCSL